MRGRRGGLRDRKEGEQSKAKRKGRRKREREEGREAGHRRP